MSVVSLDYQAWITQFPAFQTLQPDVVLGYWDIAGEIVGNTPCCGLMPVARRTSLLNLMTAHIAQLFSGANGAGPAGVVGRITSATEGSVSVSVAAIGGSSPSAEWYNQTQYGALAWLLMGPYRSARYVPGPVRSTEPWRYGAMVGPGMWRGRWGA